MKISLTPFARAARRNSSTTLAIVITAIVTLIAPMSAEATPISYGITIGGNWECGPARPIPNFDGGQPCPSLLTGSLVVDSSKATFAEQLISVILPMSEFLTYTEMDLRPFGVHEFDFDDAGFLTGARFGTFIKPNGQQFVNYQLELGTANYDYRLIERSDWRMYNACEDCVALAVPEPSTNLLVLSGLAMVLAFTRRRREAKSRDRS
jgi:PEP-CTERM motif